MKRRVNLKSYELRKLKSNSDEPAAAVIRRVRALSGFTGRKGLRRRYIASKLKSSCLTGKRVLIRIYLRLGEVTGTCSGAVKCVDIARNTNGVGKLLAKI